MKISFIDLKREWKYFEEQFIKRFKQFGNNGIYALGPEVEKFEANFAKYCGYKYAIGVSTGLAALEVALRAHCVKNNDEVITVANSAVATSLAISNLGAKPIFCDINKDFLINSTQIESLITNKTKAILPVHLFGKICEMEKINKLAKKYNLQIIEDACQAHGANFKFQSAINTKAFSFYPTKNLGALGEGGIIITNDEKIKNFALLYRDYGQSSRYKHIIQGSNYRIDPLQCTLLNIKLKYLNKFIAKRKQIAKGYIKALKQIDQIKINNFDNTSSFHLFVVRVIGGQRDRLKEYLKNNGINTLIHYPTSIHKQPCYKNAYKNIILKNTDRFQKEILSLPCHPFLTEKEQDYIINKIHFFEAIS